jgi:hypothetical protein
MLKQTSVSSDLGLKTIKQIQQGCCYLNVARIAHLLAEPLSLLAAPCPGTPE